MLPVDLQDVIGKGKERVFEGKRIHFSKKSFLTYQLVQVLSFTQPFTMPVLQLFWTCLLHQLNWEMQAN